jgi:hypothetical protein
MMGRMPPSRGRYIAAAVFVLVLTFAPYAHAADTSTYGINDPFADAIQLWSAVLTSVDSLAHELASALQLHQTLTFTAKPHAPKTLQQPAALAASAALATQSPPESATTTGSASDSSITAQQPQTTGPPTAQPNRATSDQTTQSPFVKSPEFSQSQAAHPALAAAPASAFVTQTQFNAALSALGASVQELLAKTNPNPIPEYIAADGNNLNPYAAASAINNLSGVTITNPTITGLSAGEIPNLSGSYLSLGGGTLSGAFIDSGSASSSFAGALGIGTTSPSDVLAVNGPIFLGSVSPAATADRLYNNGGSLYWAGSPIAGGSVGNWTTDGTNVWRTGGNVGIGTTSPFATLSVAGNGYFSGGLTLGSPLSIANGGTGISTVPSYGELLVGNSNGTYTMAATSSLGLLTANNTVNLADYGAIGDGSISNGIKNRTALLSAIASGESIVVPAGNYVIEIYPGTNFTPSASTTIVGLGVSTLTFYSTTTANKEIFSLTNSNVTVDRLSLVYNGPTNDLAQFFVPRSNQFTLSNSEIDGDNTASNNTNTVNAIEFDNYTTDNIRLLNNDIRNVNRIILRNCHGWPYRKRPRARKLFPRRKHGRRPVQCAKCSVRDQHPHHRQPFRYLSWQHGGDMGWRIGYPKHDDRGQHFRGPRTQCDPSRRECERRHNHRQYHQHR